MPGNNYARLCATRYNAALAAFLSDNHDVDVDLIADVCISLVQNLECPPLTKIRAWQLFSLCTHDYYEARSRLEGSLGAISALQDHQQQQPVIVACREKTAQMLEDLEMQALFEYETARAASSSHGESHAEVAGPDNEAGHDSDGHDELQGRVHDEDRAIVQIGDGDGEEVSSGSGDTSGGKPVDESRSMAKTIDIDNEAGPGGSR